jgi:hypothetical protein
MQKVSLFIAGNLKSGTTTFYNLLKQHPEIYLPKYKEPKFFCTDFHKESDEFHGSQVNYPIRTLDQYNRLYSGAPENKILGDCSPHYTYSKEAAQNIYKYNPDAKIVIFLREPVSFLRSLHFDSLHALNETEEDFLKSLELEESRRKGENIPEKISSPSYLYYSEWVKYREQIERYVNHFGTKQVRIVFLKNIVEDRERVFRQILEYVGVDNVEFLPNFDVNQNKSKTLRFGSIFAILKHSWFWDLIKRIVPVRSYSFLNKLFEKLFFKKGNKPQLSEEQVINLKKEHINLVKDLDEYLNDKKLIDFDLVEFWGYDKFNRDN